VQQYRGVNGSYCYAALLETQYHKNERFRCKELTKRAANFITCFLHGPLLSVKDVCAQNPLTLFLIRIYDGGLQSNIRHINNDLH